MAGRIIVEIERDGKVVSVTGLESHSEPHETGIILHGETSASPRGLGIDLTPISAGTKVQFSRVQERHGWVVPRTFKLGLAVENGNFILSGVDQDSLPEGTYELKLRIGGMHVKPNFPKVKVPKDGAVTLRLTENIRRRLKLNRTVEGFDENSRKLLRNSKSQLDGIEGRGLADRSPASRRQEGRVTERAGEARGHPHRPTRGVAEPRGGPRLLCGDRPDLLCGIRAVPQDGPG